MNTRRQTVWLVSMLGLMVVLSAYYLFTEDVENMEVVSENPPEEEILIDATNPDGEGLGGRKYGGENGQADGSGPDAVQTEDAAGAAEQAKSDEQILEELEAQATMGQDYFTAMQMEKLDELSKETEKWMQVINDANSTDEEVANAYEKISRIEEKQSKITRLEEELMKDYENAVVSEEEGAWTVLVKADKLEKSQAVSIVDMVVSELGVKPGQVQVQNRM